MKLPPPTEIGDADRAGIFLRIQLQSEVIHAQIFTRQDELDRLEHSIKAIKPEISKASACKKVLC